MTKNGVLRAIVHYQVGMDGRKAHCACGGLPLTCHRTTVADRVTCLDCLRYSVLQSDKEWNWCVIPPSGVPRYGVRVPGDKVLGYAEQVIKKYDSVVAVYAVRSDGRFGLCWNTREWTRFGNTELRGNPWITKKTK